MSDDIPVTPDVLKWARISAGLSVHDVVLKLNRKTITIETIEAWEDGTKSPTYPQLERLAYEIYKRPLALFFFPDPPEEISPEQSFRTLPEYEIEQLPPRIRMLLRKASAMQLNLVELYEGVNPAVNNIINDVSFSPKTKETTIAQKVRQYLSINLDEQLGLPNASEAFKFWRNKLEETGIFVFKDAFKEDSFSGFCVYDDVFPIIYINNSKPHTRQIFTLFHELAHLLFKTGGIDAPIENYIDYLKGDSRRIEILCNSFAGEFLVPNADFEKRSNGLAINDYTIEQLANGYNVSREVILRKFFDKGEVDQKFYNTKVNEWAKEKVESKTGSGNYYLTKGAYLGTKYIEKAFSKYYQNQIPIDRLADYLGVKVKSVAGMETLLNQKGLTV